ncbi:MAG: extracellular solute-binding protein, partial [Treponema sp.]|nr:extracellular solute-binding protein [Treponema sp.]
AASPAVTQLSSFLYAYGTNFLKDNVAIFDNPDAIEAVRVYGRLNGTYGPQGIESMSWDQLLPVFQAGKIAIFVDASTFYGQLVDPAKSVVPAANVGVAQFPAGPKGNSCYLAVAWAMGISSKTKDMDSAMKFLNWATAKDQSAKGMGLGIAVARTSVWNDSAITSKLEPGIVASRNFAAKNGVPYDRPVMTSVVKARDFIGELITESIITKGTSAKLPALATEKVKQVNDLLKADGEYGGK